MSKSSFQPVWLQAAWRELHQREQPGAGSNARILDLYRDAGHPEIASDDVAWCAAFTGAVLARSGLKPTGSLQARSYLDWGEAIEGARLGAVAVFSRGSDPAAGHVAFVIGETADALIVLGGNQSDAVTVGTHPRSRLLGLRWPAGNGSAPGRSLPGQLDVFPEALAHVLELEGGYSDDPLDPGGPTNHGLTLADLSRHRGLPVTPAGRDRLVDDLRHIGRGEVEAIYRALYWHAAGCDRLPPPLALFHFDTAVNMGVGTASLMLQGALGVAADGAIGPLTIAAAAAAAPAEVLDSYSGLRRRRYRSLSTFARFGRGWLARVDRTLARSLSLPAASTTKGPAPVTSTMTTPEPTTAAEPKWWGSSMTIWGALVTGLAAVLPVLAPAIGVEIPKETVTQSAEQIGAIVQAATGLAGTLMTIFGRLRATKPLARRAVTLHV